MKVAIQINGGHKIVNLNRRRAIRERCLNCSAWSPKEVAGCNRQRCPLHPFRTGQGHQDAEKRARAIRAYCLDCMAGQRGEVNLCPSTDCSLFPYRKASVDRSVEIKSLAKNERIAAVPATQTADQYQDMACHG